MTLMFDGETYDPELDEARLSTQLDKVKDFLWDGEWKTLRQIHDYAGGSVQGVSARVRDLRKDKHGGYVVEHRRVAGGLWEYRIVRTVQFDLFGRY